MTPPPMDKIKAKENLLEVKEILDNLKIKFWLVHGTCLGAVREGRFIPYDWDIDLTFLVRDFSSRISEAFSKIGAFSLKRRWPDKPAHMHLRKNQIYTHISLRYYFPPKDIYICLSTIPRWQLDILPGKLLRDDYWVNFLDTKFRVPSPPEEYLEYLYGENWRIPHNPREKGFGYKEKWNLRCIPDAEFVEYVRWIEKHPEEF